jgi:hypothetical protein
MRCGGPGGCHRELKTKGDVAKRAEFRELNGELKVFGHQMPAGPLSKAGGQLRYVMHNRCYWIAAKNERRGGPRTGLVHAYEDDR